MKPTQYYLMMTVEQFAVDGCHLDGGRAKCGLGDHQGGQHGGGTGVAQNIGAGELWSCWPQYVFLEQWEVTVAIEIFFEYVFNKS